MVPTETNKSDTMGNFQNY